MFKLHRPALLATCFFLSNCGVTYVSPKVEEESASYDVSVIAMTPLTVSKANTSSYRPKQLPAAFSQTASNTAIKRRSVATNSPTRKLVSLPPEAKHSTYKVGIGDVILLATRSAGQTVEQLTGLLAAQSQRQGYTVRDDGAIAIPEVGAVAIEGLTIEQAEERVFQRLVQNQLDPEFSLEISEFNSKRVSIGGAVRQAKIVPITLNPLYLDEALTAAGGISLPTDATGSIWLYRNGKQYQIPLDTYFKNSSVRRILLVNGDSVYIQSEVEFRRQELEERRKNFEAKLRLGAIDQDYVYLTGETKSQNRIALPFEAKVSLADVFYENGGFPTATGDPSHIYVLRFHNRDTLTAYHLDAKNVVNMAMATKFEMRPDDIVFVREQPITVWARALQQAFPILLSAGVSSVK